MLRNRIFSGLSGSQEVKSELTRMIVLYLCRVVDSNTLRSTARKAGVYAELMELKVNFLDEHYYCLSRFWRGIHSYCLGDTLKTIVRKFGIIPDDIRVVREFLSLEDLRTISHVALTEKRGVNYTVPRKILDDSIQLLQREVQTIAYKKLRFIANHDPGFAGIDDGLEDFQMALLTEAIRLFHTYDWITPATVVKKWKLSPTRKTLNLPHKPVEIRSFLVDGKPYPYVEDNGKLRFEPLGKKAEVVVTYDHHLKIMNYLRRGIRNFSARMIDRYTAQCRSRLTTRYDEEGNAIHRVTTISMDTPLRGNEEGSVTMIDLIPDNNNEVLQNFVEEDLLKVLCSSLPERLATYVNIITGEMPNVRVTTHLRGFQEWACGMYDYTINELDELDPEELSHLGMLYLKLTDDEVDLLELETSKVLDRISVLNLDEYVSSYLELDAGEVDSMSYRTKIKLLRELRKFGRDVLELTPHGMWYLEYLGRDLLKREMPN